MNIILYDTSYTYSYIFIFCITQEKQELVGKGKRKERYGIVGYKWFSYQGRMVRMINA
jgi:hypothetical protein